MSRVNLEIVEGILDAWGVGDFSAGLSHLDPNVTFVVGSQFPERGVAIGPEAISEYMLGFLAQFEPGSLTVKANHLQAMGDTVMVEVAQHGKGRASGVEADLTFFMLFTFRGRKIVRIDTVMDEAEALEAAGLRE